jgi:tripeptide aminopeptidase
VPIDPSATEVALPGDLPTIDQNRLVDLFLQLCKINAPSLQEIDSVKFVRELLEREGIECWEDEAGAKISSSANNLIARLRGNLEGAPRVFLSAHFDTVEPTEGLTIEERDGVFYSDGTTILGADDKGGMAPAIEALLTLKASGLPHGDVYLLFSIAEEIGLLGAANMKIEDLGLDFGYVLDTGPPVGTYVNRAATHDYLEITLHGRPAHAGKDPENGINAIQIAAKAVEGMRLGRIGPETTANLGTIAGGSGVNVVCPSVKIRAEARSTSLTELDAQIEHMIQRFEAAARELGGIADIQHHRHYGSYQVDPSEQVVKVAQRASQRLGLEPTLRLTLGGSDANVFNARGLPTIVAGTGMSAIHTHEEFISRDDLIRTAELALALLLESAQV